VARIFITGSADGLGKLAARLLAGQGHEVVAHGRNPQRARDALASGAASSVHGDLSTLRGMNQVAAQVNALGEMDAVIHNAGIGYSEPHRETEDGLPPVFSVNSLAPYVLTALIPARRLVYLSSGLHRSGDASLEDLLWKSRRWNGFQAYSDSKLHDVLLAFAIARRRPGIFSNAVEPGWVPTKMGGPGAPDDLQKGAETQAWLAAGTDTAANVSARYLYHQLDRETHPAARDEAVQEKLIAECERISGVKL
jgi:NAD(P)-dependent dehydrogenase (short-subunit alcohol dehydrogenase family)